MSETRDGGNATPSKTPSQRRVDGPQNTPRGLEVETEEGGHSTSLGKEETSNTGGLKGDNRVTRGHQGKRLERAKRERQEQICDASTSRSLTAVSTR